MSNQRITIALINLMLGEGNLSMVRAGLESFLPGPAGDIWQQRTIAFIGAITRTLVYLRDMGLMELSADVFLEYLQMKKLEELVFAGPAKYGEEFGREVEDLRQYVLGIPGYNVENQQSNTPQATAVNDQHGYVVWPLHNHLNSEPVTSKVVVLAEQKSLEKSVRTASRSSVVYGCGGSAATHYSPLVLPELGSQ